MKNELIELCFQDADGRIPVTAVEQPVGCVKPGYVGAAELIQRINANRPTCERRELINGAIALDDEDDFIDITGLAN